MIDPGGPVELTMPLGDPGAMDAEAGALERSAGTIAALAVDFSSLASPVADHSRWSGQAAERYCARVQSLGVELERIPPSMLEIATALRGYAAVLRRSQYEAQDAATAYRAATQLPPGSQGLPMAAASQQAADAQLQVERAAARAAAEIAGATARLPRFEAMGPGLAAPDLGHSGLDGLLRTIGSIGADVDIGAAVGANFFRNFIKEVGGYTTRAGVEVHDYVRWRPGLAGAMNEVTAARNLEYLKYADRADWPLAVVAAGLSGFEQYQADQTSGHRYTGAQETARVGASSLVTGTEVLAAGATGMAIGAAVGTVVPGAGTVVGAGIGFVVGAGISIGVSVAIDHFHVNDRIKDFVFHSSPLRGVFGG
jgi:uncharacterized protein YukE